MGEKTLTPFQKTIIWIFGNAAFGLAPLLFMLLITGLSSYKPFLDEVHQLIDGGLILFVCCAVMGSVVIDILLSKLKFRNLAYFTLFISPFLVLGFVLLAYLLIRLNVMDRSYFSSRSWIYYFVIGFSIFYCTLAKYTLYSREKE